MNTLKNSIDESILITSLAKSILEKRDEDIEAKVASGIESEWAMAQKVVDGQDINTDKISMLDVATGTSWKGKAADGKTKSKIIVNIVRSKCSTRESKFGEIMFPSDDKNWGMKPTPVPDNPEQQIQLPQPAQVQPGMEGQTGLMPQPEPQEIDPEKALELMEEEIDDQLNECEFNGECRKVSRQAIKLGTSVLRGPSVIKRVKKSWRKRTDGTGSVHVLEITEEHRPESKFVSVWDVYPAAGWTGDIDKLQHIWERDTMLPRELRDLIGLPGYNTGQIKRILREEPIRTRVSQLRDGNARKTSTVLKVGSPYERWLYHGDVNAEFMEIMGCSCDRGSVSACIEFVNDRPIKAVLNTLDTGAIPYDFFQWIEREGSPWGMGEPAKLFALQRVMTGAWRMMMDNAGDSAGTQTVVSKDVEPENGIWEFSGRKFWINEGDLPAQQAFYQFQLQNNQQQYESIIELALKFADIESGIPTLMQGDMGHSPETLGGMELLLNSADVGLRDQVKNWDDKIIRPHLKRYYDWNMQYNRREEIKREMVIDARGVSVMLAKDATFTSLMQMMSLRADPEAAIIINWENVIKQLVQARHLQDVLRSDDEIKQAREQAAQQPQPVAPAVEAAKIRVEGDIQKAQLVQQSDVQEIEMKKTDMEKEFAFKLQQMEMEHENKLEIKKLEMNMKIMELAQAQQISIESIKSALADTSMRLGVQKELSFANMEHTKQEGDKDKVVKVALAPPTEPVGQAPPGESFQK